jgi:transcriptional regulator with XRE-family HTH domain
MKKQLNFGEFIADKRKNSQRTITITAERIGICTVYLSELESGKKTNPNPKIMRKMVSVLRLNAAETALFYDLQAKASGGISQDLPNYIMKNDIVRKALRRARDKPAGARLWREFLKKLD